MLSRVADSIYWMSRYVERAENVARFINVNLQLILDAPPGLEQQWQPLIDATGDQEDFARRYGAATQDNVLQFLTFDPQNPNSILSCLQSARENARSVREVISSAMWLQLNKFYLMVKLAAAAPMDLNLASEFYHEVILASQLFIGITDTTMSRGKGWHFAQLGRMLERADKVSRILDIKYQFLLRSRADAGTASEHIQWGAVLRSASAFEMYCKRHGRITPRQVAGFLMLDGEFPRSMLFCLRSAHASLLVVSGTAPGAGGAAPERLLGRICSDLGLITVDEIIQSGLHAYIDSFQARLNQTAQAIFERFFAFWLTPGPDANPPMPVLPAA
jgi:uncharacterized alpha-E superfamily protein